METMILLISDSAGIYVPRNFYENFDLPTWGINSSDYMPLSHPDNDDYWETWDDCVDTANHTDDDGINWTLYMHEGSLFAVSEHHSFENEET